MPGQATTLLRAHATDTAHDTPCRIHAAMPEGSYDGIHGWPSRLHWLRAVDVALSSPAGTDARAKLVSIRCCHAVAGAVAAAADGRTGRASMPGNAALMLATGYKRRAVQLAVRALVKLGYLVRVRAGKNWLSLAERLELWRAGSRAREFRAIYACTLPTGVVTALFFAPRAVHGRSKTAVPASTAKAELAPLVAPGKPGRRRSARYSPPVMDLAMDLRATLPQLRRVNDGFIYPQAKRFADRGWSAADLKDEIDACHRRTGTTAELRPAAPLTWLSYWLNQIEPADNPALVRAAMRLADRG